MKKSPKVDRKRPVSLLGVKISIAIPFCGIEDEESLSNNTSRPITVAIWIDGWGKEKIATSDDDRAFIDSLPNATEVRKYLHGVAKAANNLASKLSRVRWTNLASK
jgi:hypothetical protein